MGGGRPARCPGGAAARSRARWGIQLTPGAPPPGEPSPVELAQRLRAAGLVWHPAPGDRFVLPDRGMDHDVFVISDLTIEVHDYPTGRLLGFNGTTEWALDSVDQDDALWLPAEDQLRELLGPAFRALHREDGGYRVAYLVAAAAQPARPEPDEVRARTAWQAYATALLHVLTG